MKPGTIGWIDLTVPDAPKVRDFYRGVVGWETSDVNMGTYNDFCMHPDKDSDPVAGVCHAKGTNANLPSKWLIYITVENTDEAAKRCQELGGKVLQPPKDMGSQGRYCVIEDPAGAVSALFSPAKSIC